MEFLAESVEVEIDSTAFKLRPLGWVDAVRVANLLDVVVKIDGDNLEVDESSYAKLTELLAGNILAIGDEADADKISRMMERTSFKDWMAIINNLIEISKLPEDTEKK